MNKSKGRHLDTLLVSAPSHGSTVRWFSESSEVVPCKCVDINPWKSTVAEQWIPNIIKFIQKLTCKCLSQKLFKKAACFLNHGVQELQKATEPQKCPKANLG